MNKNKLKEIVVLYHADCPDGFGSAWAAWKKFGKTADYVPVEHGESFPIGLEDKELYLLDFSYGEEETAQLIAKNKRVTTIDHHITSEQAIKMTSDYRFSLDNSGSILSWDYFHKGKPTPKMLQYIEDRDLWRFKFPETDNVCAFIDSLDFDFKVWDKVAEDMENENTKKEYQKQGQFMLTHEKRLMEDIINANTKKVMFEGYDTYVANAPYFFASHIGQILIKKLPPIAITWNEDKNSVHISLRSDGTVNVGEIAKKYGGGGHKMAAGFELPSISLFPWRSIK